MFFLQQTLRRKGLGLDGSELDSEESAQAAADKYPGSDSMDLSVARQRFCVSPRTLLLSLPQHRHRHIRTDFTAQILKSWQFKSCPAVLILHALSFSLPLYCHRRLSSSCLPDVRMVTPTLRRRAELLTDPRGLKLWALALDLQAPLDHTRRSCRHTQVTLNGYFLQTKICTVIYIKLLLFTCLQYYTQEGNLIWNQICNMECLNFVEPSIWGRAT